jgi:glucosamine--fructose-6-phosphate aminotransferase (isomerizing)
LTTIFEEEIRSQGAILRQRAELGMRQAREAASSWERVNYALAAARGSSDNAAAFFQYLAGRELGLVVALATPSLFHDEESMNLAGAGVVAISQSGKSPGMLEVIRSAKFHDRPNVVITNDANSALALEGDSVIELFAGPERAIASTKTFTTSCHALAQFVSALRGQALEGLEALPDVIDRSADWALSSALPTSILNAPRGLTVVGRGIGAAVASEIALKIREVTGVRCEAYSAPDYLHGPIGADGDGATLLVVVTEEMEDEIAASLIHQCTERGMRTVILRSSEHASQASDADIMLEETTDNWCLGLALVVVGQVLSLRLGELRGRPIDTAPGLNKVTLTA